MTSQSSPLPSLDRRLHAYRPDLADAALEGRVEARRFVSPRQMRVAGCVVPLKRAPSPSAALDSQLLFGEKVNVFEERDGWAWVQNRTDDYVGYVPASALDEIPDPATHRLTVLSSYLYPKPDLKSPTRQRITLGARLAVLGQQAGYSQVAGGGWVYSRHLAVLAEYEPDYVATALLFLGAPYLWGGRESAGLDCSALVQLALDRAGIPCPRDSDQQEACLGEGQTEAGARPLRRGDLVYFPGHVAIALDETQVLNANAHAMLVSIEPIADLVARVETESGGTGITSVRRIWS